MPKYAALIYRDEAKRPVEKSAEERALYAAWGAFRKDVDAAGVMKDGGLGLSYSSSATTVRVRDGKTLMTDGPFAETREQLGGVFIFECADLDEALSWASRIPDVHTGAIEVRPLWQQ